MAQVERGHGDETHNDEPKTTRNGGYTPRSPSIVRFASFTPRAPTIGTVEQLLRGGVAGVAVGGGYIYSRLPALTRTKSIAALPPKTSGTSPIIIRDLDLEENQTPRLRRSNSVLARVKEKAKIWQRTLAIRRQANATPSWGVSLDDVGGDQYYDEDPEFAAMYEAEVGPEASKMAAAKEAAKQLSGSGDVHVVSQKQMLVTDTSEIMDLEESASEESKEAAMKLPGPGDIHVVSQKHVIVSGDASEIMDLEEQASEASKEAAMKLPGPGDIHVVSQKHVLLTNKPGDMDLEPESHVLLTTNPSAVVNLAEPEKNVLLANEIVDLEESDLAQVTTNDKLGTLKFQEVSVSTPTLAGKEASNGEGEVYIIRKLEPGKDDRTLSDMITQAISPGSARTTTTTTTITAPGNETTSTTTTTTTDVGVVGKFRGVVTSLLPVSTLSSVIRVPTPYLPQRIPIRVPYPFSTTDDPEAAEDENQGRALEAN